MVEYQQTLFSQADVTRGGKGGGGMNNFTFTLDPASRVPLYQQLYAAVVGEIRAGRLRGGERLPSKRSLCRHLGVSRSTVETAYGILCDEGYISSRERSGYFACELFRTPPAPEPPPLPRRSAEPACRIDFSTGDVDTSAFPYASWARLTKEVVYSSPQLLQRGDRQGDEPFRRELCAFLREWRGVSCMPEQIVIGAGVEYLTDLLLQLLPEDAAIALEDPGYTAARRLFELSRRAFVPVRLDAEGMDVQALEDSGAAVAYLTPAHQFPMGMTMPVGRRTRLLKWASEREGRYIVEDDYDGEFRYFSRTIPAMQGLDPGGRVIYIGTFSRSLAPSIRVAYMVLPPPLLDAYLRGFAHSSSTVSRLEQETLRRFIAAGLYGRHLRRMNNLYRRKQALLTEALLRLEGASVSGADAGLHLLLRLEGADAVRVAERAAEQGVRTYPLASYAVRAAVPQDTLVLGFAGLTAETIAEGCRVLAQALAAERANKK
ncbi:MAG: PLP-dependent aminotransferase family protein [Clostridia bacterium]|nr:PLP-dependent aminotransferase family protein [Clostridia bacterium]